jgi:DNA-directed RNA polymerase specialized sigma24 family protein
MLYERLHALARRLPLPPELAPDAASDVCARLIRGGPRGRWSGPDTEAGAEAFLVVCVRNRVRDMLRARGRERAVDADVADASSTLDPWTVTFGPRLEGALQRVATVIRQEVRRLGNEKGAEFARQVWYRREVAGGRMSQDDCVRDAFGEVGVKTRNRFYQRQLRAMRRLVDAVEEEIRSSGEKGDGAEALRAVVRGLRDLRPWVADLSEIRS